MKPILYTIDGCVNCYKAKQHLIQNNIPFTEKNVFIDENSASEIKELLGEVVTPVFVSGHVVLKGKDILEIGNGTSHK
jgi:arsenate reductase-like glutaredoxin family protein